MKSTIRNAVSRLLPEQMMRRDAYNLLVKNERSYLHKTGWIQSLRSGTPSNADGAPLPWMNLSVVKLLEGRLSKDMSLFEFGSGYSTAFYARLVKDVVSVEYNQEWIDKVAPTLPDNASIVHVPNDVDGAYCRAAAATGRAFDVVVVDGRDRVNCVKQSAQSLSDDGVMLLDDSHRERYREAFDFLGGLGFKHLSIEGLKVTDFGVFETTIFYRDQNVLGL